MPIACGWVLNNGSRPAGNSSHSNNAYPNPHTNPAPGDVARCQHTTANTAPHTAPKNAMPKPNVVLVTTVLNAPPTKPTTAQTRMILDFEFMFFGKLLTNYFVTIQAILLFTTKTTKKLQSAQRFPAFAFLCDLCAFFALFVVKV
jgi:hypothetical protein